MKRLFILGALFVSYGVSASQRVEYLSDTFSAEIAIEVSDRASVLHIRDSGRGQEYDLSLPRQFSDISQVFEHEGHLVILGKDNFSDLLLVLNLHNKAFSDFLRGRQMSPSPDGRFVVFEKFYPSHGMSEQVSHLTLIYDLEKSPSKNRLEKSATPSESEAAVRAGLPVYPVENTGSEHYSQDARDSQPLHAPVLIRDVGYVWSFDGKNFAFSVGTEEEARLVIAAAESRSVVADLNVQEALNDLGSDLRVKYVAGIEFLGNAIEATLSTGDLATTAQISIGR